VTAKAGGASLRAFCALATKPVSSLFASTSRASASFSAVCRSLAAAASGASFATGSGGVSPPVAAGAFGAGWAISATTGDGTCCCGGRGKSRSASSAMGTLTTATIAAVASAPNARRSMPSHFEGRRAGGVSSMPSNFRRAASIASLRAAGRGGGGSGSESRLSLSIATRVPSKSTLPQTHKHNRGRIEGPGGRRRQEGARRRPQAFIDRAAPSSGRSLLPARARRIPTGIRTRPARATHWRSAARRRS
jgi:hypothetical protein